jgi:hypothetical protein
MLSSQQRYHVPSKSRRKCCPPPRNTIIYWRFSWWAGADSWMRRRMTILFVHVTSYNGIGHIRREMQGRSQLFIVGSIRGIQWGINAVLGWQCWGLVRLKPPFIVARVVAFAWWRECRDQIRPYCRCRLIWCGRHFGTKKIPLCWANIYYHQWI